MNRIDIIYVILGKVIFWSEVVLIILGDKAKISHVSPPIIHLDKTLSIAVFTFAKEVIPAYQPHCD